MLEKIKMGVIIFHILNLVKRIKKDILRLKLGYVSLLSSLFCCVSGDVWAFPQDWLCGAFDVAEVSRVADFGGLVRFQYAGEKGGVRMTVEAFSEEEGKVNFDCGNAIDEQEMFVRGAISLIDVE